MQNFKKRISLVPHNKGVIYRVIGDITPEMKQVLGNIVEKAEIDMGYVYSDELLDSKSDNIRDEFARILTTVISILKKQKMFDSININKVTELRIQFTNKKWIAINSSDFFKLEVLG